LTVLFTPLPVGGLTLANRIVIAPMCQYSAVDGCMTDWHLIHLGHLALSGAALLTIEATAVLPEGRITYADVGLWSDDCEAAMRRVLDSVRKWSPMPVAIQLAHAGRKASTEVPWKGGAQLAPDAPNGWQTQAPSAITYATGENPPAALDHSGLVRVRNAFADAARRAARLGLDAVQLHAAHGYLLHEFLSPLSNRRDDDYGGSLKNRMGFLLEVFDAVREAVPADRPVSVRVSATDWIAGGWDLEQTVELAQALETHGLCRDPRVERRHQPRAANPRRPELPSAARPRGQGGDAHAGDCGRSDHRVRAGRGDRRHRRRRHDRFGAGDSLQPALAVARRRSFRRTGSRPRAIPALAAPAVPRPVRLRTIASAKAASCIKRSRSA
jgi:2,4-dienoyl-CoA reductase-like NADH-dependent reductase (Old Yellow Enzyme family)